jgi:hypothetical protein
MSSYGNRALTRSLSLSLTTFPPKSVLSHITSAGIFCHLKFFYVRRNPFSETPQLILPFLPPSSFLPQVPISYGICCNFKSFHNRRNHFWKLHICNWHSFQFLLSSHKFPFYKCIFPFQMKFFAISIFTIIEEFIFGNSTIDTPIPSTSFFPPTSAL